MKKNCKFLIVLLLTTMIMTQIISVGTNPALAENIETIIQDSFSGTRGGPVDGRLPDGMNLPGGSWQVCQYNNHGIGTASIYSKGNSTSSSLRFLCNGKASVSAAVPISSSGNYIKPVYLNIKADITVMEKDMDNDPPYGAMLGFYSTPPADGTNPVTGFTGLVLDMDGSLTLVEDGATVTSIVYSGSFEADKANTLSYTIDTYTGAISNVQLSGSTSSYNFTSSAFTDAATRYAATGALKVSGRDCRTYIDNFVVDTVISDEINIATNKVVSADSTLGGRPAARANDEDKASSWAAANANPNHWWKVDLNGSYDLTGTEILFPKALNYKYKIDVSPDDINWTLAADNTETTGTAQTRTDRFTARGIRYVRVTITGLPGTNSAVINEFKAFTTTASGITYYTIENYWTQGNHNGYLYDNNGINVAYNNSVAGDKYRWCFEDAGEGYFRIKNKATGNYMNISAGEMNVICSSIAPDDITGHWTVGKVNGNSNKYIINRSNGKYLNIENANGYATCERIAVPYTTNFMSEQWLSYYDSGSIIPITGISVIPDTAAITGYKTKQLNAYIAPVIATNQTVNWISSDPSIAYVSPTGMVYANKTGTVTITAAAQDGGLSDTCQITVNPIALTGISISPAAANLRVGEIQQLTPVMTPSDATNKAVSYSTSNSAVATVSSYGVIKAVAPGSAVITATTQDGGKTAVCEVNVSAPGVGTAALKASDFLDSISVCTHIAQGQDNPDKVADALAYTGIRNIRDDFSNTRVQDWINIYNRTGARINLLAKKGDVALTISVADQLAAAGALLSIDGPNEPNNWAVTYEGMTSGYTTTFQPVARFQRDLYAAVKADPNLSGIPVFNSSEAGGSEPDNVGLQFNTVLESSGTLMPAGTQYADYANCHNYVSRRVTIENNTCWDNFDPTLHAAYVDGMYDEYGVTWHMGYKGYELSEMPSVPRVCTETGWTTAGSGCITPEQQGRLFLTLYPSAFKQGWKYTFIYMLHDSTTQGPWGFVDNAYNPKPSAIYMHNLTTILADNGSITPGYVNYSIENKPATVHDLLLQKSDGKYELLVWSEKSGGSEEVTVNLGASLGTVNVYDPTTGTAAIRTLNDASSVPLTLNGYDLRVIELQ